MGMIGWIVLGVIVLSNLGLDQFGAEWYALAPNGHKIDHDS